MKVLIFSMLAVTAAYAMYQPKPDWNDEWKQWKLENQRSYVEDEEDKRKAVWEQNRHVVLKHNYEYDLGMHTFRLGMNQFADMTNDEFKSMYLGGRIKRSKFMCKKSIFSNATLKQQTMPSEVDWRKHGYVTPVKNQGQCGSCWAFSTTGSTEGQHFKKTKQLVSLSEQNLLDCSKREGDMGCAGGLMDFAFDYIILNKGIDTEASYPYEARQGTCRFKPANIGATLSDCVDLPTQNEDSLKKAVAEVGPISVAIDASHLSFQLYESGVYSEPTCSQTSLDHGVLAVGYGTENGNDYWLVKNSWGQSWGKLGGYIKMSRNNNNNCGIATSASYPIV